MYPNAVESVKGGMGNAVDASLECRCLAGDVNFTTCIAGVKQQWHVGKATDSDGYFTKMAGFGDKASEIRFKNGAVLYHVNNHLVQVEPVFGIDKMGEMFGWDISELDAIYLSEVRRCRLIPGLHS
mmetsp:Transcript_26754/g.65576  ORF Transcript_26754/g.65576 Transcript_26754/m.65576 type:complete len:126 (-) Transcript_26754:578-955(-)